VEAALAGGHFEEAADLGDRLASLAPEPETRARLELDAVRALIRGRKFEEARRRLARIEERAAAFAGGSALDLRRRIHALEVARGLRVPAHDDRALLADADALGDPTLRCEARMALAGVLPQESAMELAGEAVALSSDCAAPIQFAARVLRFELNYALSRLDHQLAERDLKQALAIAGASLSAWQEVHIAGDLAVLEAEMGQTGAAIDRLRRLLERAEAHGMRGQLRLLSQNLAAFLLREGRAKEAAETARRTAELATEAGDPVLRAAALSLRAAALRITGNLAAALESVTEAEQLQRDRGDRGRALALLRRADILDAMRRTGEALEDARTARRVAEQVNNKDVVLGALVLEKLRLAQQGDVPPSALRLVLDEARASNVTLRMLTQSLVMEAEQWLSGAPSPAPAASGASLKRSAEGPVTQQDETPPMSPTALVRPRLDGR
jgi:tetratricopeptide (TPR) repeat protein